MSIPDAPWIGMCREDYYGYRENRVCCDRCGEEFDEDELIEYQGEHLCKDCYDDEEDGDEELHG